MYQLNYYKTSTPDTNINATKDIISSMATSLIMRPVILSGTFVFLGIRVPTEKIRTITDRIWGTKSPVNARSGASAKMRRKVIF